MRMERKMGNLHLVTSVPDLAQEPFIRTDESMSAKID